MNELNTGTPEAEPPDPQPQDQQRILIAIAGFAALVLIIGVAVWIGTRDDQVTTSTVAPTSSVDVSTSASTSTSTTSTTTTSTTTTTTTSTTTTTVAPTTTTPSFALPAPSDTSWTVDISQVPDAAPLTMNLATTLGDVRAYDGVVGQERCIGVVGAGDEYSGWCGYGPDDLEGSFVIVRGITPWLVEFGPDIGDIELHQLDPQWRLPSNGCSEPVVSIIAGANLGPLTVSDLVCAGPDAFIGIGPLLFGEQRAPDGGGVLVVNGDEGWGAIDFGTSIDCAGWADGVDRCASFGVESELFEALLPIPPIDLLTTATDIVGVRDETAPARAWVGAETEPPEIEGLIFDLVVDPEAEVPATVRSATGVGFGDGFNLLVIDVPAMDDSILSTSWAAWISPGSATPLSKVFAWETCARGLAEPGLCI